MITKDDDIFIRTTGTTQKKMAKCLKCKGDNSDGVTFCAHCGSALLDTAATSPKPTKTVQLVRIGEGGVKQREDAREELKRALSDLTAARNAKTDAEDALNSAKHEAEACAANAQRLTAENEKYRKIGKFALPSAGGLILLMLILLLTGSSGRSKLKRERDEYLTKYDNVSVERNTLRDRLRDQSAVIDSLKKETVELRERLNGDLPPSARVHGGQSRTGAAPRQGSMQIHIDMIPVKGGTFRMGCTPEQGDSCNDDEKPVRRVTVNNFSIGKYPVTQGQWRQVMGSVPQNFRGNNHPVEHVTWRDAQEFIKRLNHLTGRRYRLPTEAEWEYAARGGANSRGTKYAGSNNIEEVAWYGRSAGTSPVGGKKANELGIHDMSGNVSEWTSDRYGPYSSKDVTNPQGPGSGNERVLRGGGWTNGAASCRVSSRSAAASGTRGNYIGFRLAH